MEVNQELFSNENKENALRRRVSENTANSIRACLADITHRFV